MPYIYATLLPTDYVKVGVATNTSRATAAGSYHVGLLHVLGLWQVADGRIAERKAHRALWWCHVERELFHGDPQLIVEAISDAIGAAPTILAYDHEPPARRGVHTPVMRAKMLKRT